MKNLDQRNQIIEYSLKLNSTNLSPLRSGNISLRGIEDYKEGYLITPSGKKYETLKGQSIFNWIFTVDVDEFIYNKNLDKILDNTSSTVFKCTGYDLHFDNIPGLFNFSDLTSKYNLEGRRHKHLDKFLVFDPNYVDIRHDTGCHDANPCGFIKYDYTSLYNLQLKFLGKEYFIHINEQKNSRSKKHSIETNFGFHYNSYLEDMNNNPTWYEEYDRTFRKPLHIDD